MKQWYSELSKGDTTKSHKHYCNVDSNGIYFAGDISWPGGGGPLYDVMHPVTKKSVRKPQAGWRFPKFETMKEMITDNRVEFGDDENKVPTLKRYLHETEGQVLQSVIYKDRRAAMQRLRETMNADLFDNPKDESILSKFIEATSNDNDIILDFFAGSGTAAQAVLELNKEDNGNRKFILVQLPEKTAEDSEAYKAGYITIADICKERIRRVIKNLESETKNEQIEIGKETEKILDLGFKVFKLKNSNFKLWRGDDINNGDELAKQLDVFKDPVKTEANDENIVYELMLKMGLDLNLKVEKEMICIDSLVPANPKNDDKLLYGNFTYYKIDNGKLIIFTEASGQIGNFIREMLKKEKPEKVICLDRIFDGDDETKTNLVLQMRDAGVEFKTV